MVIYEVICENIIHMYMHICMSIFSWRTKSYKIWIQESKLWWWCHAKTNTCPMIWLWSPDWSWYSPMAWNDQKCTSYLLVCFLYCCLQHINETTIFLISILLWLHFLMIYVNVYISVLILNKVFFFDCRMSNDLWYSVINGTLRNWIWDGWQNRRDKVLSHLVTDHMF